MYPSAKYIPAGDQYMVVEFGNEISLEIHQKVRGLFIAVQKYIQEGILEVIPTYRSLLIHYDPLHLISSELISRLQELEAKLEDLPLPAPKVFKIPVCYGGELGPDLRFVAKHSGLTPEEVVRIHSKPDYLIYMLGFTPGFCYLGGLSRRISAPRLKEPRPLIPAGSVGIAGDQTGMYPIDSPGGWQLIGRTPIRLFDPLNEAHPFLLQAGEYVRYFPVPIEEYREIASAVSRRAYRIEILTEGRG